ncbi:hypothetical protein Taro_014197 [Colocasia esculenta]|uniref:Uncharacterized protein n=1 Tax=Colocasia esculenta TaxID=4460 RepID=A0A843UL52_COLES|nr:hypothetical protein [Colocasia esculenta]
MGFWEFSVKLTWELLVRPALMVVKITPVDSQHLPVDSVMGEETQWKEIQHAMDNLAQPLERVVPVDDQGKMKMYKSISNSNSQETVNITVSIQKKTILPSNREIAGKQKMKRSKENKKTKKANKQANLKAQPKELPVDSRPKAVDRRMLSRTQITGTVSTVLKGGTSGYVCGETNHGGILFLQCKSRTM